MTGVKYDKDKARWDLLPWREVAEVVAVLTHGAKKYADDNWKSVEDSEDRYFAAAMRHLTAWWEGDCYDPESKQHHLAHAVCCLLFLMWFDLEVSDLFRGLAEDAPDERTVPGSSSNAPRRPPLLEL